MRGGHHPLLRPGQLEWQRRQKTAEQPIVATRHRRRVLFAPRGLPPVVSKRLSDALKAVITDPSVREALQKTGLDVAWQPGSVYDNQVARELPLLRAYVHKANIPVQ